jgi:hypothetical protein
MGGVMGARGTKQAKGSDYLSLALLAFAGFAFELVLAYLIEPAMGLSVDSLTTGQNIVHWLVTSAVWVLVGVLVIRHARRTYGFDLWEKHCTLHLRQWAGIVLCVVVMLAAQWLDWGGFRPAIELQRRGPLLFVFQYVYYLAEAFLLSLIIIYGQRACEVWFKNEAIPYGGIVLALTWGLGHIMSKGSVGVGLLAAAAGFLFGAAYLLVGRDYRKALPLLYVLFVI